MAEFKDHFSGHSAEYAKYRPGYPPALFDWLASLVSEHTLAWDVGTGSGQAAIPLARYFARVIATDASEAQLRSATAHERVAYKALPAERTDLAADSVDLITVAQALHWFDFERFYAEARRVLKQGGAIVAWTYGLIRISPAIDAVIDRYYTDIVGGYWPPERAHVDTQYRTIPFPFAEIVPPSFDMQLEWNLPELIGNLDTWSAAKRYQKERGVNPFEQIRADLAAAWGAPDARRVASWPLVLRAGRMPGR